LPNGAAHSSELACQFLEAYSPEIPNTTRDTNAQNPISFQFNGTFTAVQRQFCTQIATYITSFVVNGNPNNASNTGFTTASVTWNPYNSSNGLVQHLGDYHNADDGTIRAAPYEYANMCDNVFDVPFQ